MKIGHAVAVLVIAAGASKFGTPHLLMTYSCRAGANGGCGTYQDCTYLGLAGYRRYIPEQPDEACRAIMFLPAEWPWSGR
jgi:hypothetical protein